MAQDCGLNKSKPLLVTVEVKQACSTGWSGMNLYFYMCNCTKLEKWHQTIYNLRQFIPKIVGLPSQVSYIPGTGPQSLFSDASFSLCETETNCKGPSMITANVILETEHIGKVVFIKMCFEHWY